MIIEKYGIKLKLVDVTDADFILKLRTSTKALIFLSQTSENVKSQIAWIEEYKKREAKHEEYYYIIIDKEDNFIGTIRIYNLGENCFEVGSWSTIPNQSSNSGILGEIVAKSIGFYKLGYNSCRFSVRSENKSVIRYHTMYNPQIISNDEQNIYFLLTRDNFEKNSTKFLKPLGYELDTVYSTL